MNTNFKERTFEGENHIMQTFEGYNKNMCIMFNGTCVHSVKSKVAHEKRIKELCEKYEMSETTEPDEDVQKYIIKTEVLTSDNKRDKSEAAQKAMNITANVTKTKSELKDFMIQWQKHKAKDFPAGKVFVTSMFKNTIADTFTTFSEARPEGYKILS